MSIVVHGLRKAFGTLQAVDDVSFEIPPGTIVGLIGPNGSGKSTILRMLATFLTPDAGSIEITGIDVASDPIAVRGQIGYLVESLPGHPDARISEYLDFRARLKGIDRSERAEEIARCLAACELTGLRQRLIGRLSQGQKRRVGIADALLGSPAVLLLDEPTVGLDPLQVRQTRETLRACAPATTILISTHLLAEAQAACDRVLMLVRGRLVSDLTLSKTPSAVTIIEVTLRADPDQAFARLAELPGVDAVRETSRGTGLVTLHVTGESDALAESVAQACVERQWGVRALRPVEADLESHFVRVALGVQREAA